MRGIDIKYSIDPKYCCPKCMAEIRPHEHFNTHVERCQSDARESWVAAIGERIDNYILDKCKEELK